MQESGWFSSQLNCDLFLDGHFFLMYVTSICHHSVLRPTFTRRCFITPLSFITCYIWGSDQNIRRTVTPKCYNATIAKVVPHPPAIFGLSRILTCCCKKQNVFKRLKPHFSYSERDFNIFCNKRVSIFSNTYRRFHIKTLKAWHQKETKRKAFKISLLLKDKKPVSCHTYLILFARIFSAILFKKLRRNSILHINWFSM